MSIRLDFYGSNKLLQKPENIMESKKSKNHKCLFDCSSINVRTKFLLLKNFFFEKFGSKISPRKKKSLGFRYFV